MNVCSTHVTRELAGSKVRAERAKCRSVKGQLKALRNLLDGLVASSPFGEHRRKQHHYDRLYEYEGLSGEYAFR